MLKKTTASDLGAGNVILPAPTEKTDVLLRHANLMLAALRAENALMKENIRSLMQTLDRFERAALMGTPPAPGITPGAPVGRLAPAPAQHSLEAAAL